MFFSRQLQATVSRYFGHATGERIEWAANGLQGRRKVANIDRKKNVAFVDVSAERLVVEDVRQLQVVILLRVPTHRGREKNRTACVGRSAKSVEEFRRLGDIVGLNHRPRRIGRMQIDVDGDRSRLPGANLRDQIS